MFAMIGSLVPRSLILFFLKTRGQVFCEIGMMQPERKENNRFISYHINLLDSNHSIHAYILILICIFGFKFRGMF